MNGDPMIRRARSSTRVARGTFAAIALFGTLALDVDSARAAAGDEVRTLTLERAVELAHARTRQAIHARDDVLLAEVGEVQALAPVLPQVDLALNAGVTYINQSAGAFSYAGTSITIPEKVGADPSYYFSISAKQLIWDGGRWWAVIARAKAGSDQARAALAAVENDVRLGVARRFYEVEKARRAMDTFERQIAVDEDQLARVRAMLEAGRGKVADVAAVERNLAEDRITLSRRKNALRAATRALNLALGWDADTPVKLELPSSLAEGAVPEQTVTLPREELVELARARRPELASARASLEIARRGIDVAKADFLPKLGLSAGYTRSLQDTEKFFASPTHDFNLSVGLGLNWNLFAGRATQAAVETAELNAHKQQVSGLELERSILGEVDEKLDGLMLQLDVQRLAGEAVRAAEEAVRLARGLYEAGKGTLLELRDAELKLTLERLAVTDARLDLEIAREELRHAVGAEPTLTTSSKQGAP